MGRRIVTESELRAQEAPPRLKRFWVGPDRSVDVDAVKGFRLADGAEFTFDDEGEAAGKSPFDTGAESEKQPDAAGTEMGLERFRRQPKPEPRHGRGPAEVDFETVDSVLLSDTDEAVDVGEIDAVEIEGEGTFDTDSIDRFRVSWEGDRQSGESFAGIARSKEPSGPRPRVEAVTAERARRELAARGAVQADAPSGFLDKVILSIPGEVVVFWLAFLNIMGSSTGVTIMWSAFAVAALATPLYTWLQTSTPAATTQIGRWNRRAQIALATVAFPVWVYSIGPPFDAVGLYNQATAGFLILTYTLLGPELVYGLIERLFGPDQATKPSSRAADSE
ncbi:hypothetical protein ACFQH6_19160 [Halobacteriaceae archaeon GCM10025711]